MSSRKNVSVLAVAVNCKFVGTVNVIPSNTCRLAVVNTLNLVSRVLWEFMCT